MKSKKEEQFLLKQIQEMVKKKVKTFDKEYIDNLDDNEIIAIPLIAFEGKKQVNLGMVKILGKNVKEVYYDKKLSVKSTINSVVKDDDEIYIDKPQDIDDNAIVLKKRYTDTRLN